MLLAARDDMVAFGELVSRYQASMVRLMRTIGPRPGDAEDLAQETFLRLYRARHRYQPTAKFSTYLYTIAGNVGRNARRSAARRREYSESDAPLSTTSSGVVPATQLITDASSQMPTRRVEQAERAAMVRAAIESLNPRQKMAIMLSRFENMSYDEIAQTMEISPPAVKSLLSRARVCIGEFLTEYVDPSSGTPS